MHTATKLVEPVYEDYSLGILRKSDYDRSLDGLACGRVHVYTYILRTFLTEFAAAGKVLINEL